MKRVRTIQTSKSLFIERSDLIREIAGATMEGETDKINMRREFKMSIRHLFMLTSSWDCWCRSIRPSQRPLCVNESST